MGTYPKIEIRQIFYDADTYACIRPGLIPLDNSDGISGWYEFWPILKYLRENNLDDDTWYGFVSPKFPEKARVSLEEVFELLRSNPKAEVALISYRWKALATYLNPWLAGEVNHPGLLRCSEEFLSSIDADEDLGGVICDFSNSVFSNYVIAKSRYWRAWLELAESYFQYVTAGGSALPDNAMVRYRSGSDVPMRVFVQERFPSVLLLRHNFSTVHIDYVALVGRGAGGGRFPRALKMAFLLCNVSKVFARRTRFRGFLSLHRLARSAIWRFSGDSG